MLQNVQADAAKLQEQVESDLQRTTNTLAELQNQTVDLLNALQKQADEVAVDKGSAEQDLVERNDELKNERGLQTDILEGLAAEHGNCDAFLGRFDREQTARGQQMTALAEAAQIVQGAEIGNEFAE